MRKSSSRRPARKSFRRRWARRLGYACVAGVLCFAGIAASEMGWRDELENAEELPVIPDPSTRARAFPAADLGSDSVFEDTRRAPAHVVDLVLGVKDRGVARTELRQARRVASLRSEPARRRERPEAPPAVDSGDPDPDRPRLPEGVEDLEVDHHVDRGAAR